MRLASNDIDEGALVFQGSTILGVSLKNEKMKLHTYGQKSELTPLSNRRLGRSITRLKAGLYLNARISRAGLTRPNRDILRTENLEDTYMIENIQQSSVEPHTNIFNQQLNIPNTTLEAIS